jgi:hypothetical protein
MPRAPLASFSPHGGERHEEGRAERSSCFIGFRALRSFRKSRPPRKRSRSPSPGISEPLRRREPASSASRHPAGSRYPILCACKPGRLRLRCRRPRRPSRAGGAIAEVAALGRPTGNTVCLFPSVTVAPGGGPSEHVDLGQAQMARGARRPDRRMRGGWTGAFLHGMWVCGEADSRALASDARPETLHAHSTSTSGRVSASCVGPRAHGLRLREQLVIGLDDGLGQLDSQRECRSGSRVYE